MIIKATVNGKNIYAEEGTRGKFYVNSEKKENTGKGAFTVFRTIKEAKNFIESHPEF